MLPPDLWLSLGGVAAVLTMLGLLGLWALRMVIRDELRPYSDAIAAIRTELAELRSEISALKADVAALRKAVFEDPRRRGGMV